MAGEWQAAVATVLEEVLEGPRDPRETWVVSNRAGSGALGTLRALDAARAQSASGGGTTAASHAVHLRYALDLAARALRGEDPFADADWPSSWKIGALDDAAWRTLVDDLERTCVDVREALMARTAWDDRFLVTGAIALVAHSAYHLGAIRQLAMHADA